MRPTDRFVIALYGAASWLLLAAALVVPKGEDVLFINGWHNSFLNTFFSSITYLGDGLIFVPIVLLLAFFRFEYSVIAIFSLIFHGLLSTFFKRVLFSGQLRPKEIIDNDLLYFVPGVDVHSYNSFPSGHTMTIFCAAFLLSIIFRSRLLSVLLLLVALAVGCSRIYLLQHFLIDVAGGALTGVFSTWAVWTIFERIKKRPWMEKKFSLGAKERK